MRNSADLETERAGAMRSKDALRYYSLCSRLGYRESAVEDAELYLQGRLLSPSLASNADSVVNTSNPLHMLSNSTILEAYRVVHSFLQTPHGRVEAHERELKKRLRRVKATGYPVADCQSLEGNDAVVSAYLDLKKDILEEAFRRGLKSHR